MQRFRFTRRYHNTVSCCSLTQRRLDSTTTVRVVVLIVLIVLSTVSISIVLLTTQNMNSGIIDEYAIRVC